MLAYRRLRRLVHFAHDGVVLIHVIIVIGGAAIHYTPQLSF